MVLAGEALDQEVVLGVVNVAGGAGDLRVTRPADGVVPVPGRVDPRAGPVTLLTLHTPVGRGVL